MIGVWIAIAILALAAFGVAMLLAGEGRQVWTLLASALVFALAGYAWQGRPGLPDEPRQASREISPTGDALIETRRAFYNAEGILPSRFVITADGFSRRGQHVDAAGLLRNGVDENPKDGEAWLALGIARTYAGPGDASRGLRVRACPSRIAGQPGPGLFSRAYRPSFGAAWRGTRLLGQGAG